MLKRAVSRASAGVAVEHLGDAARPLLGHHHVEAVGFEHAQCRQRQRRVVVVGEEVAEVGDRGRWRRPRRGAWRARRRAAGRRRPTAAGRSRRAKGAMGRRRSMPTSGSPRRRSRPLLVTAVGQRGGEGTEPRHRLGVAEHHLDRRRPVRVPVLALGLQHQLGDVRRATGTPRRTCRTRCSSR